MIPTKRPARQPLLLLVILLSVFSACADRSGNPGADVVIVDARIYTLDEARPWAEAAAIKDGRFAYVGDSSSIDQWISG